MEAEANRLGIAYAPREITADPHPEDEQWVRKLRDRVDSLDELGQISATVSSATLRG